MTDKGGDTSARPGPDPERLEVEGDWEQAVKKALKKVKPKGGWPRPKERGPEKDDPNP